MSARDNIHDLRHTAVSIDAELRTALRSPPQARLGILAGRTLEADDQLPTNTVSESL